jgi:NADH-quinone oxidoreductase subunit F
MTHPETLDLNGLNPILTRHREQGRTALIPALLEAQEVYGYLSEPVVTALGQALKVPLADIHGVIEFYTMLYREPVGETFVRVCTGPRCSQLGSEAILEALRRQLKTGPDGTTEDGKYTVEEVACLCLCDMAPAALVAETPVGHLPQNGNLDWIEDPQELPLGHIAGEPRWKSARCGVNDPTDLEAYEASGGYQGLRRALESLSPKEVIEEIKASGLSGRGGAAFPTGLKWQFTAATQGERYIICNGDESEPGTFKDRVLMEGDPLSILEGMAIAGYAIGSHQGYVYVRGEYPRAQRIWKEAIKVAHENGRLGEDILGSGFHFEVEIHSGAGAYICGEETALFESIEGKRGLPRLKPPYPTTHGLFGKPTMINNVETFADTTWILANGVEAYRSIGTQDSPGSKLFCLSGDLGQPGIYETPFGIKLHELIEMAGGVDGELQAVLLGGAAGTFAGPDELEMEMSFEGMQAAGHSLGSGVVMVINQDQDLRQTLLSLAKFFAHESCGKCYPCRLGTQRQLEIIQRVVEGKAQQVEIDALHDIHYTMVNTSICGLGMTATTAILSALKRWPSLFGPS